MAQLPSVNITESEGLGIVIARGDGIAAMLITCTAVALILEHGKDYQLFSLADAEAIQIDETTNPFAWKQVSDFYATTGSGAELWVMPIDSSDATGITMAAALDPVGVFAPVLIDAAGGNIRLLGLSVDPETPSVVAAGLEGDVHAAVANAQALGALYAGNNQPFSIILDGRGYNDTPGDLTDYSTASNDRVSGFIGGNELLSKNAAIGITLGTLALLPVQRRASRKRNGAVNTSPVTFTDGVLAEKKTSQFAAIAAKNYMFFKTFPGQTGYYFSTDSTFASGDFSTISRRRVMDKVIRIAFAVYTEWLDEEIPVNDDGTLNESAVTALKGDIENEIGLTMVGNGELSGFEAVIDPLQNVISNDTIKIELKPTPVGYSSQINIDVAYVNPFLNL